MVKYKRKILPTARPISKLLCGHLNRLEKKMEQKPRQVVEAWPTIVGSRVAEMTRATRFEEGILYVLVTHSTLYSLLIEHEKERLLLALRRKFQDIEIKEISFCIGSF